MNTLRPSRRIDSSRHIDAIVIGGSAGAIEALTTLLPALLATTNVAVFLVLHVPRQRPSVLREVIASHCALEVREAEDKEPVRRGVVYVAPPDYHVLIAEGPAIVLSVDEAINFSRPSIDALFETAANQFAERLVAIVLSGANSDGARGLAAVARAGGVALVQDPLTAASPEMANAAIEMTPNAIIGTPSELADILRGLLMNGHDATIPARCLP